MSIRKQLSIHGIKAEDGTLIQNQMDIQGVIPSLVTAAENERLTLAPLLEEVKETIYGMKRDSAAGPKNGFTSHFFTHCWDIVGWIFSRRLLHLSKGWNCLDRS